MKRVLILGSTGSIGESTLKVIKSFPDRFRVVGLVASKNIDRIREQSEEFRPEAVCLTNVGEFSLDGVKTYSGFDGLRELIETIDYDVAVSAISGSAGILPTYWVARKGGRLAVANKESLVCAGKFIVGQAAEVIPVDSEHSAIFQCLSAGRREEVKEIVLTASGGPFLNRENLDDVKPEEALKHPNWEMGRKVTVDSSTLMNKGLEVIEAYWLFSFPVDMIKVVIHPESIVHSMVKFRDNSVISQLGKPDMRIPIGYALSYPDRLPLGDELDLDLYGRKLTFYRPDFERFRCLSLAYESLRMGYPYPIVLNAADEVAVELFLSGKLGFLQIPELIERTLERVNFPPPETVEDVLKIDEESRRIAEEIAGWL